MERHEASYPIMGLDVRHALISMTVGDLSRQRYGVTTDDPRQPVMTLHDASMCVGYSFFLLSPTLAPNPEFHPTLVKPRSLYA